MRSFSEEQKMGTFELLITKPIYLRNIILGKFFGAVILICLAIAPTLLYTITIAKLGKSIGNWDIGSTIGSYIGLLFLILAYTSIGIFFFYGFKKSDCSFYYRCFFIPFHLLWL